MSTGFWGTMTKPAPDWMKAQSQDLSILALVLVAVGPGLAAYIAAEAKIGYWAAFVIFVILQAAALALVRRDYRSKRAVGNRELPGAAPDG